MPPCSSSSYPIGLSLPWQGIVRAAAECSGKVDYTGAGWNRRLAARAVQAYLLLPALELDQRVNALVALPRELLFESLGALGTSALGLLEIVRALVRVAPPAQARERVQPSPMHRVPPPLHRLPLSPRLRRISCWFWKSASFRSSVAAFCSGVSMKASNRPKRTSQRAAAPLRVAQGNSAEAVDRVNSSMRICAPPVSVAITLQLRRA